MKGKSLGKAKRSMPNIKVRIEEPQYETIEDIEQGFKKFSLEVAEQQEDNYFKSSKKNLTALREQLSNDYSSNSTNQFRVKSKPSTTHDSYNLLTRARSHASLVEQQSGTSLKNSASRTTQRPQTALHESISMNHRRLSILPLPSAEVLKTKYGVSIPPHIPKSEHLDYLVDKLQIKLKDDLESYATDKKIELSERDLTPKEFEEAIKAMISFDESDVGAWIRINSKYKMLRKKLQSKLIEFISDELSFKNYEIKLNYDHEVSKLDEDYDILLEDIDQKDPDLKKDQIPINYLMRRRLQEDNLKKEKNQLILQEKEKMEKKARIRAQSAHPLKNKDSKNSEKLTFEDQKKINPQTLASQVVWTKEDEKLYKENVEIGKQLFSKKVSTGTFKNIGFKDIYLSLRKKSNLHNLRNFLIEKLQDGQWLTEDELRYLTYSSGLTHAVIDKPYFTEAINKISSEVKSDIITMISEELISEYSNIIQSFSQARKTYLNFKNLKHRDQAEKYLLNLQQENERMLRIVALKKWRLVNERFCLKRLALAEAKKETEVSESTKKIDHYSEMLKQRTVMRRNKFLARNFTKPIASNYLGLVQPKKLRHLQNPASRVIKLPAKGTEEDLNMGDKEAENLMQTMHDYKNSIVDRTTIDSARYKRFYSGGPVSRNKEKKLLTKEQAAILIQKVWRGFFDRRMIRYLKGLPGGRMKKKVSRGSIKNSDPSVVDGVSNFYLNFQILKNNLLNPQNEQKLRIQFIEETRIRNQREFNRKIDKEVREKIMKSRGKQKKHSFKPDIKKTAISKDEDIDNELEEEKKHKSTVFTKNNLHIKQMALLKACKNNNTKFLKNSGYNYTATDVNIVDALGNTSLYYACLNKNLFMVTYLLKRGAKVNKKCAGGNTAVHAAFTSNKVEETDETLDNQAEIVKLLVERDADLDCINNNGQTPVAFGKTRFLKRMHLYEGKATYPSKEVQIEKDLRAFNKKLYEEDCREPIKDSMGMYVYKRMSSASTTSGTMEQYYPNPHADDIYKRRERYLASEEYAKFVAEREALYIKKGELL